MPTITLHYQGVPYVFILQYFWFDTYLFIYHGIVYVKGLAYLTLMIAKSVVEIYIYKGYRIQDI